MGPPPRLSGWCDLFEFSWYSAMLQKVDGPQKDITCSMHQEFRNLWDRHRYHHHLFHHYLFHHYHHHHHHQQRHKEPLVIYCPYSTWISWNNLQTLALSNIWYLQVYLVTFDRFVFPHCRSTSTNKKTGACDERPRPVQVILLISCWLGKSVQSSDVCACHELLLVIDGFPVAPEQNAHVTSAWRRKCQETKKNKGSRSGAQSFCFWLTAADT